MHERRSDLSDEQYGVFVALVAREEVLRAKCEPEFNRLMAQFNRNAIACEELAWQFQRILHAAKLEVG